MCYVSADTHTFFFTHWTAFMIMGLVCLLARLLKNARMDLDEMLRVDRCRDMDELFDF